MRTKYFLALAIMIICSGTLVAQTGFQLKESNISIVGTSNIHDWESAVTDVKAEGTMTMKKSLLKNISSLKVTIAVEGIISSKGSVMDKKTYKALLSDQHPNIIFELTKIAGITPTEEAQTLKATGDLTIAGTTKPVDLEVTAEKTADGFYHFVGSKALKMTDFNMEPPTALFGSLKTGDDVTVKFDIVLAPADPSSSLSN